LYVYISNFLIEIQYQHQFQFQIENSTLYITIMIFKFGVKKITNRK
jgi:hypothetical protein